MSSTMERLRQTVADGNYYEAQQLIKTLYFRFYSQKKTEAAKEILINGAFTMLNAKQTTCGAELIHQLLKLFADLNTTVDSTNIDTINRLAALIPSSDQTKISVLNAALKWSTTNDNYKQGHPDLHAHLAKTYADTEEHYLKGNSPSELSLMLRAWADQGYPSETDLFVTRTVLMYLSMSNLRDAKTVFNTFVSTLSPQQMTPLINFTRLLLLTLEHKTVFNLLRQKYATSLNRDPAFNQFLERIAQVFYSVKPANSNAAGGFGGLFNDLFKSFMSNDIELGSEDVD